MMPQPFDDDPGPAWDGYPHDMARNTGAGWDANGAPVNEPDNVHPWRLEQHQPHTCWICGRRTPLYDWLLAIVWDGTARPGNMARKWVCSTVCQMMALLLLDGIVQLDRWVA